jgi:hypothetical protein
VVEVSAHELVKTRLCKIDLCSEVAAWATGPYASLCKAHGEQARTRRNGTSADARPPPAPVTSGSYELRAGSLVKLGQTLDDALEAYAPAREAYEEAARRWQEAVASLNKLPE